MNRDSGQIPHGVEWLSPKDEVVADFTHRREQRMVGERNIITVTDSTWGPGAFVEEAPLRTAPAVSETVSTDQNTDGYPVEVTGSEPVDPLELARYRVERETRNTPPPTPDRFDIAA